MSKKFTEPETDRDAPPLEELDPGVGLAPGALEPYADGWRITYSDGVVYTIASRSSVCVSRRSNLISYQP